MTLEEVLKFARPADHHKLVEQEIPTLLQESLIRMNRREAWASIS